MPKKRTFQLKQFHGSSSSSTRPSAGQDGGDSPTSSVNERLSQLRVADSIDAAQRKRELAELVSQKSVPPELRRVLNIPDSAPPRPKVGTRVRFDRARMRTPGPAAPKSWLGFQPEWETTMAVRNMGKRKGKRTVKPVRERNRPVEVMRFPRMLGQEERPRGLLHLTLKRLAEQWDLLDEEDFPALGDIPLRLRLRLLSYLGVHGPPIDVTAFKALTQGADPLSILDLGGLGGHAPLTLRKFARVLEPETWAATASSADKVLDSWDAEETLEDALTSQTTTSRYGSLTHLSLSHPPPAASWKDLMSIAKHLPQLTHLSLAYWPRPTLTPHLATATVSSGNSPEVRAGGTHMYSGLDQDFSEAASLLRQLSSHLLCLQWLDLEGCAEWMPALAALASPTSQPQPQQLQNSDDWGAKPSVMTIFTDTWKNVSYINCSQGWTPLSANVVESLNGNIDAALKTGIIKYLRKIRPGEDAWTQDVYDVEKRRAWIWIEQETKTWAAAKRINTIRRARSEKPITFDFGWLQEAVR